MLTAEHLDVPLDFEGVGAAGSMLGTRALQIFDETTCVVRAVLRWTEFYKHESCGKCTPCREGTCWLVQIAGAAREGRGHRGRPRHARSTSATTSSAGRSARSATARPARSPRRSSTSATSTSRTSTHGGCPFDPEASHRLRHGGSDAHDDRLPRSPARPAPREVRRAVTLTIDGVEVAVPKGTLVIRAAEQIGIEIPRFCDHPLLDPVGACRQCLVEVDAGNGRRDARSRRPPARITGRRRHGRPHPGHLAGRRQGAAGRHGVPAHQPPARLPGLRQGRRVPAAEPGDEPTAAASPASPRRKRTFPKPINISAQVLLDRERCVLCARCTRFSEQIAGDPFIELIERGALQQVGIDEEEPFESYFSGNTDPDLPGRRADLRGVPLPRRGRSTWSRRRRSCEHCASRLRAAHRPPPRQGHCAGWPATTPRSTRSGTATRAASRSATPQPTTGSPARWSATTRPASCVPASWPEALAVAARGPGGRARRGRRARRRPAHRRGRLRLRQVRPRRARHQRHRLPGPAALRRGGRLPRRRSVAGTGLGVTYADLEQRPRRRCSSGFEPEEEAPIVFLRLRKAARGARHRGLRGRAVRHPRPAASCRGTLVRDRARRRGRRARRRWSPATATSALDAGARDPGR